jgi:hypothetical protein
MSTDILKKYVNIVNEGLETNEALVGPNSDMSRYTHPDIENGGLENRRVLAELEELEEAMHNVIDIARNLRRSGRQVRGPFVGQLESYFIPWMESFIEDRNQPGSIAALRRMLDDE